MGWISRERVKIIIGLEEEYESVVVSIILSKYTLVVHENVVFWYYTIVGTVCI